MDETKMPNSMERSTTGSNVEMPNSPKKSTNASMNTESVSNSSPKSITNELTLDNAPTNYDDDVTIDENADMEPDRSPSNMSITNTNNRNSTAASSAMSESPEERTEEKEYMMPVSAEEDMAVSSQSQEQGETVYMEKEVDDVTPIIMHVMPHKGHHFKLHARDEHAFTKMIEEMGYTVEFPTEMNSPDVIVSNNGDVICKVHFLLCNKKDADKIHGKNIYSAKMALYYIHLYFFASFDPTVKDAIVGFFTEMATNSRKSSSRMSVSQKKSSSRMSVSQKKSSSRMSVSQKKSSSRMSVSQKKSPQKKSSSRMSVSHRKSPSYKKSPSHRKSPSYKPTSSNKYLLRALSRITSHKSKKMHYPKRYHKTRRGKMQHRHGKMHHGKTHRGKTWRSKKQHHHTHKRHKRGTHYRHRQ
jgi:hypothetical protein